MSARITLIVYLYALFALKYTGNKKKNNKTFSLGYGVTTLTEFYKVDLYCSS
jgi:hypothetical protein